MFHWFGTVTNTKGDSLTGWQVECVHLSDGSTVVPIYADENLTPVQSVSGLSNRVLSDADGNYDFFVPEGTYSLRFYNAQGVFQRLQRYLPMYGNAPEAAIDAMEGAQAAQAAAEAAQVAAEGAAEVAQNTGGATIYASWTALAAATGMSAGDAAIVFEDAGTHTDPVTAETADNAGIYIYSASPAGWERVADTEAVKAASSATLSQAWAEGTLPGGAGTKSAKEHADDAAQSAAYAGGFETPEYASQSAGNAATTPGQIFRVPIGTTPQTFNWYRRLSSGSELVSPLAITSALGSTTGAGLVGHNDGAGGTLWTTIAGFIAYLRSSAGANAVGFLQSGTGAAPRAVQDKLRDVVSVKDFGAVGDGVADDTVAIQNALNASHIVYVPVPAVAYSISSINIPANRTFITESGAVKFQQRSGLPVETRVFRVMGSNVTIGDMIVQGNIATDTNEQNHCIMVSSGIAGVSLSNINIGNIRGINIRGDVVYIGQVLASGTVSGVKIASADGNNILRNVVSIVGGSDIEVGRVTGSAVGYMHLDVEPDGTYTGSAVNVRVGLVKGRHIGVVVNNPSGTSVFNENICFGEVNLDPAFATQSTPAYSGGTSIAGRAVLLRSHKSVHIGTLKVNGFDRSAIWLENGGIEDGSLVVDQAYFSNCNLVDGNTYGYVECANVTFNYLNVSTPLSTGGITQRIFPRNNCSVLSGNFSLGEFGQIIRGGNDCFISNSVITGKSGATGTQACINGQRARFVNCTISAIERLANFSTGVDVENCTVSVTVAVLNSTTRVVYKNSVVQGQYYALATGARTHTEALAFGDQFLWVDATGDLRIKSGAPTSDTDGTVVGTQT